MITTPPAPDITTLPQDITQYPNWLAAKYKYNLHSGQIEYDTISAFIRHSFEASAFWESLLSKFGEIKERYFINTGYTLFSSPDLPHLILKPFSSFFNKTYRSNFIKQRENADAGSWLAPD